MDNVPTWWLNKTFMPTSSQCWVPFFFTGLLDSISGMLFHSGLLASVLPFSILRIQFTHFSFQKLLTVKREKLYLGVVFCLKSGNDCGC